MWTWGRKKELIRLSTCNQAFNFSMPKIGFSLVEGRCRVERKCIAWCGPVHHLYVWFLYGMASFCAHFKHVYNQCELITAFLA